MRSKILVFAIAAFIGMGMHVSINTQTPYHSTISFVEEAEAGFSSSRSFSSRSVRVTSFKPTKPKTTTYKPKPTTTPKPTVASKPRTPTAFERAGTRQASRQAAQKTQKKYATVPSTSQVRTTVTTARTTPMGSRLDRVNRDTYYDRRKAAMGRYSTNSTIPQTVIYRSSPSFGLYDSWFMWYVVMGNPSFGYHHYNDPGYMEWKREATRLAESNEDLRKQLAAHEQAISGMTGPRDANYVPDGVDADVIFAPAMIEASKPVVRFCTGRTDGTYFTAASTFDQVVAQSDIQNVSTAGSVQNLEMLKSGDCDAAFVQRDAYIVFDAANPNSDFGLTRLGSLYNEDVHLFCSVERDAYHLSDLTDQNDLQIYVGDNGSGAAVTWDNIVSMNEDLADITVVHKTAKDTSFGAANHCGLYVGKTGSSYAAGLTGVRMLDIESVPTNEVKDPAGADVYATHTISGGTYRTQLGWADIGWFTSTPTVTVPVDIVVSDSWKASNPNSQNILTELNNLKSTVVGSL